MNEIYVNLEELNKIIDNLIIDKRKLEEIYSDLEKSYLIICESKMEGKTATRINLCYEKIIEILKKRIAGLALYINSLEYCLKAYNEFDKSNSKIVKGSDTGAE